MMSEDTKNIDKLKKEVRKKFRKGKFNRDGWKYPIPGNQFNGRAERDY